MSDFKTYVFLLAIFVTLDSCDQTKKNNEHVETKNAFTNTKHINADGLELLAAPVNEEEADKFLSVGQLPEFLGGYDSLKSFIQNNIEYPKSALQDRIQGSVKIKFTIDTSGKVIDVQLYQGVREDLDTICLSVVRQMPNWTVGRLGETPIAVWFILPIKFILDNTSSTDTTEIMTAKNLERAKFISKIYPNPTKDFVNIELQQNSEVIYLLTDLSGKTIFQGQFQDNINKIDLSGQQDGIYALTLINMIDKQKQTTKIIKTK